jgi:hypothetical protein
LRERERRIPVSDNRSQLDTGKKLPKELEDQEDKKKKNNNKKKIRR